MAHPVRPDSYMEINNFYTATVYEKGAELVRMYQTVLGRDGFRRGMDLYFERHDGQAVTTDDFCAAMADANGVDLSAFKRWYERPGTPELKVSDHWDADAQVYELIMQQSVESDDDALVIPVDLGLLGRDGVELPLRLDDEDAPVGTSRVVSASAARTVLRFVDVPERPVPSLLRGFSAPIKLHYEYSDEDLLFLMRHDTDAFNRWEASQQLAIHTITGMLEDYRHDHALGVDEPLVDAFRDLLEDRDADPALIAETLSLPSEAYLAECFQPIDPAAIHRVRCYFRRTLASSLRDVLVHRYRELRHDGEHAVDATAMARRRLRNACLGYLAELDDPELRRLVLAQFEQADNMTDALAALQALSQLDCSEREAALHAFESRWRHDPLVMDKWFALQAGSRLARALDDVRGLMAHPLFSLKNPNRVRALIGAFAANSVNFHDPSGRGYEFIGEQVLALDAFNPQVAARLAKGFSRWRLYEPGRGELMRQQLRHLAEAPQLSRDVYEIVSKSLDA
jgi:aminopeptidase N